VAIAVDSAFPDVRDIPLAAIPDASGVTLDRALARILPGALVAPVPVAAFSSAI
jgi:FXSXX-COOH protein